MKSFTLVELIAMIAIIAALVTVGLVFVGGYVQESKRQADKQTLVVLNDALGRYKTQGGDVNALTSGVPIRNVLSKLQTAVNWSGMTHQFLQTGKTYFGRSIDSLGTGHQYRFTRYDTYTAETGGTPEPTSWLVTTFAGSTSGYADGTGAAAQFSGPSGVAVDSSGNLYVCSNNRIRKVTPAGVVTTLAGSTYGYVDGTGAAAQFRAPSGVAVDGSGNVYVADSWNNRIRKVTPAGVVTTLAGSTQGYADGTGVAAKFDTPSGVTVDSSGNVYVADTVNHRIRKITPAGVVTTLAGSTYGSVDGTGAAAKFYNPFGVVVDSSGSLYVGDYYNNLIRQVTPVGVVTTLAGSTQGYADGTGAAAKFYWPKGVAIDSSGNLYVADENNNRIRKITSAGVVTTLAGSTWGYADNTGAAAQFSGPIGVAVDSSGNLYVADLSNNRIRKITPQY